jgi:hypothetical protein
VRDIDADHKVGRLRRPFKVQQEEHRRFIRLEIASPMSLQKIKDGEGHYWPEADWHVINGMILNISGGGVLVDLDQAVEEGDLVSMRFTLQDVEGLDNVLGLVKRVDIEAGGCLAGIEFISAENLMDLLSQAEFNLLSTGYTNFDRSVRDVIDKYVTRQV